MGPKASDNVWGRWAIFDSLSAFIKNSQETVTVNRMVLTEIVL